MTESDSIRIAITYDPALLAAMARYRPPATRRIRTRDIAFGFVLGAGLTAAALLLAHRIGGQPAVYGAAIGAGALWLGVRIERHFWRPRWLAEIQMETPEVAGGASAILSAEGVRYRTTEAETRIGWSAIDEVAEFARGVILATGPVNCIPLLDDALPAGLTRRDLLARIDAWKSGGPLGR